MELPWGDMLTVSGRKRVQTLEQDSNAEMQESELIRVSAELTTAPEETKTRSQEPENLPEEEPDANPQLRRSTRSRQPPERYGL